jgi:hypothetical protein
MTDMNNPTANMQQLVAHWNTIMVPPGQTPSKKRRRNDDNDRVLKPRTHTSASTSPQKSTAFKAEQCNNS